MIIVCEIQYLFILCYPLVFCLKKIKQTMKSYLFRHINSDSYFKKLRIELNAINLLTESIQSENERKEITNGQNKVKRGQNLSSELASVSTLWEDKVHELYKRVNMFIQTLTEFITATSDASYRLPLPGIISSPKTCSLPTACRMLWRQVEAVCKDGRNKNHSEVRCTVDVTTASKSNQTQDSCLSFCESCQLSTGLVRALVHTITDLQRKYCIHTTHVSQFREQVALEVAEMSEWGAMSGWVRAIQQDVRWASQVLASCGAENTKLVEDLRSSREEQRHTEDRLKSEAQLIQTQLAAEKAENKYLKHQVEDLNKSLERRVKYEQDLQRQICEYGKRLQTLQEHSKALKDQVKDVNKSYKSMKDSVKTKMSSELRAMNRLSKNTTNILTKVINICCDGYNEQTSLKTRIQEKNDLINDLYKKNAKFEQENKKLNKHVERLEAVINEKTQEENVTKIMQDNIQMLEISLEESKAQVLLYKSKLQYANQLQVKFSGDPLKDMERQRQINKKQMKKLIEENMDLKNTIEKLKLIKEKPK